MFHDQLIDFSAFSYRIPLTLDFFTAPRSFYLHNVTKPIHQFAYQFLHLMITPSPGIGDATVGTTALTAISS